MSLALKSLSFLLFHLLQPEREKELDEVEDQVASILNNIAAKILIEDLSLAIATALVSGDELMTNKLIN